MQIDLTHVNWSLVLNAGHYIAVPAAIWGWKKFERTFEEKVGVVAEVVARREAQKTRDELSDRLDDQDVRLERIERLLLTGGNDGGKPNGSSHMHFRQ